jgi:hypothetical protein
MKHFFYDGNFSRRCLIGAYLQVSEAYIDYAQKCDVIFGAQRDIALQIPDVADRDIQVGLSYIIHKRA